MYFHSYGSLTRSLTRQGCWITGSAGLGSLLTSSESGQAKASKLETIEMCVCFGHGRGGGGGDLSFFSCYCFYAEED